MRSHNKRMQNSHRGPEKVYMAKLTIERDPAKNSFKGGMDMITDCTH